MCILLFLIYFSFSEHLLELHHFQFSEKDDGATIQSLKDEIEKKNKEMDMMKRKDFDTLRKQNESISHLQREFDDFADNANEQIQTLTAELQRCRQLETAKVLGANSDQHVAAEVAGSQSSVEVVDSDVSANDKNAETDAGSVSGISVRDKDASDENSHDGADMDTNKVDEEQFKFKENSLTNNQSQHVSLFYLIQLSIRRIINNFL